MKVFAAAVLLLVLAGCAAGDPAEHPAEAPAASSEHGGESSESGEPVAYPPGFPTDIVPMFDGTLLHVAHPGNLWAAWIESHDLAADLATASQLLVDAGFSQTAGADGWAEFSNADRSLRIIASDDASYGPCLAYTITDGAIEPEDAEEQDAEAPAEH